MPYTPSPSQIDPTLTATLRRAFATEIVRRFNRLAAKLHQLIDVEDAFGLAEPVLNFNPNQPRDSKGRWTSGGSGGIGIGHFPKMTKEEVDEIFEELEESMDGLDKRIVDTLYEYTGNEARRINRRLRMREVPDDVKKRVKKIDSAFRDAGYVSKDITVYRGVNTSTFDQYLGSEVGTVIKDRGYLSTTTSPTIADEFGNFGGGVLEIRVPKGSDALPIGGIGEEELLLRRNLPLKLVAKDEVNRVLSFEIIKEEQVKNARFTFLSSDDKLNEFRKWLQKEMSDEVAPLNPFEKRDQWWRRYIEDGFKKGMAKTFAGYAASQLAKPDQFTKGRQSQFMQDAFNQPATIERVKVLASRVFTELKGVTDDMSLSLTRTLTDGLVQGKSHKTIAREITQNVRGISKKRAQVIARTEIVRAYNEGAITAMEELGLEEVGFAVEWTTATNPCPKCAPLKGLVITPKEARGMLPRHPNCRCAAVPHFPGLSSGNGLKKTKKQIQDAIDKSVKAEIPKKSQGKRSVATQRKRSTWVGAGKRISEIRPKVPKKIKQNVKVTIRKKGRG